MSDNDLDVEDTTTDDAADQKAQAQNWRRKLEQDAEDGRKASADAAAARRELAFHKAGVDLDSPQGKLLAKAYEGDPTAEAVKAFAVEHGILAADQPAVPAEELAAHDRLSQATSGAATQSDEQGYEAAIRAAQTPDDVIKALRAADPNLIDHSAPGPWLRADSTAPIG
jgi:hypothetical protein